MKNKLLSASIMLAMFLILIVLVRTVDVHPIGPMETEIGLAHINKTFSDLFGLNMFWYSVTEITGILSLITAALIALLGLLQLITRKSLLKVDREIICAGFLYAAVIVLYVFFEKVIVNYRPFILPGNDLPEASFPSSHTMLVCVVMGSALMLSGKYLKNKKVRVAFNAFCYVMIFVTVIGRLLSGAHWLTDIIGGLLISSALLVLYSAFRNNKRRPEKKIPRNKRQVKYAEGSSCH